ncbi:hypothetical protein LPB142_10090 [Rhodobacter xanthinilyticus]|uniref:Phasin domain-containing protein n=1 Tax=Rhodobacter xanthinilyticus TaxID=1850250 RepID=A0A1D9MCN7_9RHOB|nr:phasin family protein [Rhodobacter xanthinilyticus]AOZ69622.1 hypothetical protein LPB142_10090 [Rhodobacter xanthinilyticus]
MGTMKKDLIGGLPMPGLDMAMFLRPQVRMAEALLKQNVEVLDFLKVRFERDRALMGELAKAADPQEAMAIWSGFWQGALGDYASETNKLAAAVTEIAEQAVRTATEEGAALTKVMTPVTKAD